MENAVNQRSPIRSEASSEPTFDFDLIWTLEGAETCTVRSIFEHASAGQYQSNFWLLGY